jgi:hypothetical protein
MKATARIISYLFHPLLFPTYATAIILAVNPNLFGQFADRAQGVWMIIVFALTFIFPAVWILMMKGLKMIDSLTMETTQDRIIPFIATASFYLWATWMFKPNVHMKIPNNMLIFYMLLGSCFSLFMAFFINIFAKISLHSLAAGSLLALLLALIHTSTIDMRLMLIGAILLAGIIGSSRLILNAHSEREVFSGYLVGFTGQFLAFTIIPRLF